MSVVQQRPSQTLLEAILAIGVILVSVFASTTLIVSTITAGQSSEDKIIAGNLAREGIEVVRGIRDSNWLKRSQNIPLIAWNSGFTTAGNYGANFAAGTGWTLLALNSTTPLVSIFSDGTNSYFTQGCTGTCTSTKFSRTIAISSGNDTISTFNPVTTVPYITVTVTISWDNHGSRSLVLTERLYDWR